MAANKVVEYIIAARDKTGAAVKSALGRISGLAKSVGSNLMNIKAGFDMLKAGVSKAMEFVSKAFAFETMTVQFKTLIGNMDEARAHMKMLQDMGDTPPFSLEEFAAASRELMKMTDGVLGYKASLELCGDAAAATGTPVNALAHEIGRAYAIIRDGQPITRATMALRNMGVITPEVAAKMDEMQNAGASNVEIWQQLETAMQKYKGAMAETEQTGNGLIGAIQSQWEDGVREFGAALMETGKDCLGAILEKMKELREDGTIAVWADKVAQAMDKIAGAIRPVANGLKTLKGWYDSIRDGLEATGASVGAFVGTALEQGLGSGGANDDAWEIVGNAWNQTRKEQQAEREMAAERNAKVRQAAAKREEEKKIEYERKQEEEEENKLKALEEGQRKLDEKRAIEKAKAEEDAAKKAAEAAAKAADDERKREETERLKIEARIHRERVKLMQEEFANRQKSEQDAQARLSAAISQEARAWGWYRNKDSMAAQLAEENADAAAQKQYVKDFSRLKWKYRDWRTTDRLSVDEEAVRRVALAREEKAAAQEYARITAEATQSAAQALEAIQTQLEGE